MAYLAGRGVIGWDRERVGKAWRWSSRAWMVHVGLELARLGYQWREFSREEVGRGERLEVQRERERVVEGEEKEVAGEEREESGEVDGRELEVREEEVGEERREMERMRVELGREGEVAEERWEKWTRELGINTAYAPITVHYSLENGPLGEGSLGALGAVVGWLTFGRAWRASA